jgi:hypothetical protein
MAVLSPDVVAEAGDEESKIPLAPPSVEITIAKATNFFIFVVPFQ